ncbi:hypothetical protein [Burkholderia vietnamiensis]|uniref:hypothetical protein n=1 Tax=Burkholderia vietnamiensis TaxID=60552 RepID=UPI001D15367B|nr:hypothetical protein [Burkholderia vietnamiensis]UEC05469.1 hypothetical protein LK462_35265 [Burkholderia vietnamiensis]
MPFIEVPTREGTALINPDQVITVRSADDEPDHTEIQLMGGKTEWAAVPPERLQDALGPFLVVRVHKVVTASQWNTCYVRTPAITSISKRPDGCGAIQLADGRQILAADYGAVNQLAIKKLPVASADATYEPDFS